MSNNNAHVSCYRHRHMQTDTHMHVRTHGNGYGHGNGRGHGRQQAHAHRDAHTRVCTYIQRETFIHTYHCRCTFSSTQTVALTAAIVAPRSHPLQQSYIEGSNSSPSFTVWRRQTGRAPQVVTTYTPSKPWERQTPGTSSCCWTSIRYLVHTHALCACCAFLGTDLEPMRSHIATHLNKRTLHMSKQVHQEESVVGRVLRDGVNLKGRECVFNSAPLAHCASCPVGRSLGHKTVELGLYSQKKKNRALGRKSDVPI